MSGKKKSKSQEQAPPAPADEPQETLLQPACRRKRENRQLAHLAFAEVRAKADAGQALNLRELAIVSGFGYSKVRGWMKLGLPLFQGKIFWSDFLGWKALLLDSARASNTGLHKSPPSGGKPGGAQEKHGGQGSSSRGARRSLKEILG